MKRMLIIAGGTIAAGGIAAVIILQAPADSSPALGATNALAPFGDIQALQAKATQRDVSAEVALAKAFAAKMDYAKAAQWYTAAMTNGSLEATACLGELYQSGRGAARDLPKAIQLFTQAADKGNVTGQYDLAFLYEQGIGVTPSKTESAKWYRLASEGGDPTAQYDYGQRCFLGVGAPKDPVEGMKWLLIAGRAGQPDAPGKLAALQQGMTSQQTAEARRKADLFKPRPPAQ